MPSGEDKDAAVAAALAEVAAAEEAVRRAAAAERSGKIGDAPGRLAQEHDRAIKTLRAARARLDAARGAAAAGDHPGTPLSTLPAGGAALFSARQSSGLFEMARQFSAEPEPATPALPRAATSAGPSNSGLAGDAGTEVLEGDLVDAGLAGLGRVVSAGGGVAQVLLAGGSGVQEVPLDQLRVLSTAGPGAGAPAALRAWLTQVVEPTAGSAPRGRAAFDAFIYPLEETLLPRVLGRITIFLGGDAQLQALQRAGALERMRKELRSGFDLIAPDGTELLQEALAGRLAEAAGSRFLAVDSAALDAVKAAAPREGAGAALAAVVEHLAGGSTGELGLVLWLRDRDVALQSASVCEALAAELRRKRKVVVLSGRAAKRAGRASHAAASAHSDVIPFAPGSLGSPEGAVSSSESGSESGHLGELREALKGLEGQVPEELLGALAEVERVRKTHDDFVSDDHGRELMDRLQKAMEASPHTQGAVGSPLAGAQHLHPVVRALASQWPLGGPEHLNIEWRRFAQLADSRVARATHPRFSLAAGAGMNELEAERATVSREVLPMHLKVGLPDYTRAVRLLWEGERDAARLHEGLRPEAQSIATMLLLELNAQVAAMESGGPCVSDELVEASRAMVDALLTPDARARLLAARAAAADKTWPPPGVRITDHGALQFILKNEVVLRRVAQLAVPARCAASSWEGFGGGSVEDERGLARAHLQGMQRAGWILTEAVEKMWQGERGDKLAEELDPNSACIVRAILATVRKEEAAPVPGKGGAAAAPASAAVRWEHQAPDGSWEPLPAQDAAMLQNAREAGVTTLDRVHVSFSPFKFSFDLKEMKCTDHRTGAVRDIARRELGAPEAAREAPVQSPRSTPAQREAVTELLERMELNPPKDPKRLQLWHKLLRRDVEMGRRQVNTQVLLDAADSCGAVCPCVSEPSGELAARLSQRELSAKEAAAAVAEALVHVVGAGAQLSRRSDGPAVIEEQSLLFGLGAACKLQAQAGARPRRSTQELEKLVGKNKHEKGLLEGLVNPDDIGVGWDQVGGLAATKELLREAAVYPLKYPELYQVRVGAAPPGVLLFGPPGTGKTLLAKAVATETGASFLYVDSTSIGSKWYGESEKYARAIFTLARKVAPTIIFIDEIDSLAGARDSSDGDRGVVATVKTTLLREWDGLAGDNEGVMVIGATNRPYSLDEAVLSRMPRRVLVDLPTPAEVGSILSVQMRDLPKGPGLDLQRFAERELEGYTGRDIRELVRVAALAASHQVARELDRQGQAPSAAGIEASRRALTLDDLKRAKERVRPTGSESSEMLSKIKDWAAQGTEEKRLDMMYM